MKKRVVQVISAMAHHGYLELEGGELLVRFIVQNCSLPDIHQVNHAFILNLYVLWLYAFICPQRGKVSVGAAFESSG